MKSIYSILISLILITGFASCTDDFESLNTDPNRIDKVSQGSLLSPILYEVGCFNYNRSDDFTFNIMQIALSFPSESSDISRYYMSTSQGNSTWTTYYRWLTSIQEMYNLAVQEENVNYQAIAMTLSSWVFQNLTDCFGDVPMTEACKGEEGILKPVFDDQKDIYTRIIADLDSANNLFDVSKKLTFAGDLVYSASTDASGILKWKKFCNSLRMRCLLRLSKRDNEMHVYDELRKMVNNPSQYPVISTDEESALLPLSGITPELPPIARPQDFTSYRAAGDFFVSHLNDWSDPRLPLFATHARDLSNKSIGYKGAPSGYAMNTVFDYVPSNMNQALAKAPLKVIFMSHAEVKFILAELAQAGKIEGDAKSFYEEGVKAAIRQWGVEVPANYFDNPGVAYDGTLDRIMLQKYYALFFTDYQQWFEYRRTGLPVLPDNGGLVNGGKMPVRFYYPTVVTVMNSVNYKKAVEHMGGDNENVKNWWEK